MRLGFLMMVLLSAGCSLLEAPKNNFPLVLSLKSESEPKLIYGCVARWLRYQDTIILTAKSNRVYGWNSDKNHFFSLHADGKKVEMYAAVMAASMENKLRTMATTCSADVDAKPPSLNYWSSFYQP